MDDVPIPPWLSNAAITPARDQDGAIIGVELRCLIEHDDIALLPDFFMEAAHRVLDREASRNARGG